jgi:hypothetical protein
MTQDWRPNVAAIPTDQSCTLVVGWRTEKSLIARKVNTAKDATETLRTACSATVAQVQRRDPKSYFPDGSLAPEEYMAVPIAVVRPGGSDLIDTLAEASGLTLLSAHNIRKVPLLFYAAVIGDDPMSRVAFVRKANPRKATAPSKSWFTLGDTLVKIVDPIFALDDRFDLIILSDGLAVLDWPAFQVLFRNTAALAERYPEFVREIAQTLPFAGDGADQLAKAAINDTRIARRLWAIHEQGHLNNVTIKQVRDYANQEGLDVSTLIKDERLVFNPQHKYTLLRLLNEDLYTGPLSKRQFAVEHKQPRE